MMFRLFISSILIFWLLFPSFSFGQYPKVKYSKQVEFKNKDFDCIAEFGNKDFVIPSLASKNGKKWLLTNMARLLDYKKKYPTGGKCSLKVGELSFKIFEYLVKEEKPYSLFGYSMYLMDLLKISNMYLPAFQAQFYKKGYKLLVIELYINGKPSYMIGEFDFNILSRCKLALINSESRSFGLLILFDDKDKSIYDTEKHNLKIATYRLVFDIITNQTNMKTYTSGMQKKEIGECTTNINCKFLNGSNDILFEFNEKGYNKPPDRVTSHYNSCNEAIKKVRSSLSIKLEQKLKNIE